VNGAIRLLRRRVGQTGAVADGRGPAVQAASAEADRGKESLSQFLARVFDQLSLSAWLPAGALVLLLAFVIQLGTALEQAAPADAPASPVVRALQSIAGISLGGALLLIAAVVVLTMVTQALSFEAIRVLEGYWGINRLAERLAQWRCGRHRRSCRKLDQRLQHLTEQAWDEAARGLQRLNDDRADQGKPLLVPPNVLAALRAEVLDKERPVALTEDEDELLEQVGDRWEDWAPAETRRRIVNVRKRLYDYPGPNRMLPTRLGNVLRRHEDETGAAQVETLVQRVFDQLPASLKTEHDEQRTRLDLYCSMVFVLAITVAIAIGRFSADHPWYAIGALASGSAGIWLMYRAAVATARAYGGLLLRIAPYATADEAVAGS
jgi:hypothetical protein